VVCLCVCLLVTFVSHAKTSEPKPIEMPFVGTISRGLKEPCVRWGPDPPRGKGIFGGGLARCKALWVTAVVYVEKKIKTALARLLQAIALLPTGQCRINYFHREKFAPLQCDLSSNFISLTSCTI